MIEINKLLTEEDLKDYSPLIVHDISEQDKCFDPSEWETDSFEDTTFITICKNTEGSVYTKEIQLNGEYFTMSN